MSYKLAATLPGHSQDVRCVASSSSGSHILSSSRDRTARSWVHGSSGWTAASTYSGAHENFVNAVASLQLRDGREFVVTGSGDATILLWPLSDGGKQEQPQPQPEKVLVGHAGNVCALNTSNDTLPGMLASGSWDGTAKIWDLSDPSSPTSSEAVYTLEGATQAVWAVLLLPTSTRDSIHCLTASADKLIRLYHNASHVATFKGHEQPVRALSLIPPAAIGEEGIFASAGNDGLVKIWNWTQGSASELRTLQGHDSFVYSLATASDGTLASSGEDRTVRVWDKLTGDLTQIITIPAISIWSVAFVAGTDDIVVGSSDSLARVFTRDPARFASADQLAAFDEAVSSSTLNASQVVGDVKKSDLASDDTLAARQGKKEGEIAMVKNAAGGVEAYQWSSADGKWVKVGQVVDAVGSGRKQLYEGKEYDFVFDVDVSEGQPPLKLPYNVTQNPYEAAQLFLARNELPPSYVDQVVQFIEKNTAGATLGSGGNLDPYTGASSYKSTPSMNAQNGSGPTGAGAGAGFSGDPWGPSSASVSASSGATANAASAKARLLPLTTPLTFPQANLAAIQKKLLDLNTALRDNPTTSTEFPLDASSLSTLESCVASLQSGSSSSPFSASAEVLAVLGRLLDWPSASRFPALDLVRIVALHDGSGAAASSLLFPLLANLSPDPAAAQKENEINALLATRAIANAFSSASGREAMSGAAAEALETLSVVGTAGLNKLGKTALATVALNFSILAVQGSVPSDSIGSLVDLIQQLLRDSESETVYRALVAFGNVAHAFQANKQSLEPGSVHSIKQRAQALAAGTGEQRIKEIVREIVQKL